MDLDKHRLWEGRVADRLILPRIPNSPSPRSSPNLRRRNTSRDVIVKGTLNSDVTLKVPKNALHENTSSNSGLVPSPNRGLTHELKNDVTLEVPALSRTDLSGIIPDASFGSSGSVYSVDDPYDSDDDLRVSMTLPRYLSICPSDAKILITARNEVGARLCFYTCV